MRDHLDSEPQALAKLDPVFQSAALIGLGTPDPKAKKNILTFSSTQGIQGLREDYQKPIRILLAMVGLVLAIACENVSLLLVARNSTHARVFSAYGSRLKPGPPFAPDVRE